jgi:hypothetical protein
MDERIREVLRYYETLGTPLKFAGSEPRFYAVSDSPREGYTLMSFGLDDGRWSSHGPPNVDWWVKPLFTMEDLFDLLPREGPANPYRILSPWFCLLDVASGRMFYGPEWRGRAVNIKEAT